MEFIAVQKFILMSPTKLRQVVPLVKKLTPREAIETLPLVRKRAALPLHKAINTAIANAKQKDIDISNLVFKEIQIGEGPRLKRWRAGARGRAKPYKRRMSHVRVVLEAKKAKKEKKTKLEKVQKKDVKGVVKKVQKKVGMKSKKGKKGNK